VDEAEVGGAVHVREVYGEAEGERAVVGRGQLGEARTIIYYNVLR
jgi:hypothetical protein